MSDELLTSFTLDHLEHSIKPLIADLERDFKQYFGNIWIFFIPERNEP